MSWFEWRPRPSVQAQFDQAELLEQILKELKYANARQRAEDERIARRNERLQQPLGGTLTVPAGRVMTHNA